MLPALGQPPANDVNAVHAPGTHALCVNWVNIFYIQVKSNEGSME